MPVLDNIVQYCAMSPMARHNGVAVCSRSMNVAWRRMHLRITRALLSDAIRGITSGIRTVGPTIAGVRFELDFYVGLLDDMEDIM